MSRPTISAVVPAYNAEEFVAGALAAILSQTRPPDEVVVVDDGSTDETPAILRGFRGQIRVVRQRNAGHPAAFERACREARGDYVAKCDADDLWALDKLERQRDAVARRPDIDISFTAAHVFGTVQGPWPPPDESFGTGVLEPCRFARVLYGVDVIIPSTTLIRRELHTRLGPFDNLMAEDYDFWLRALGAGAVFHYDEHALVHYRRHDAQVTSTVLDQRLAGYQVRRRHRSLIDDDRLVAQVLARDCFRLGRLLADAGRDDESRRAFRHALIHGRFVATPARGRTLVWLALLAMPPRVRPGAQRLLIRASRAADAIRGGRHPALP